MKIIQLVFLTLVLAGFASAVTPPLVPEVDPGTGGTAIALLCGGLLVFRARRKQ